MATSFPYHPTCSTSPPWAVGFLILALAPMPLFASHGLLSGVMIALELTATLLVLPSLLVAVTRNNTRVTRNTTGVPTRIEELVRL